MVGTPTKKVRSIFDNEDVMSYKDKTEGKTERSAIDESNSNKIRIRRSTVHDHYHQVKFLNPITKKAKDGTVCKHCNSKFSNKITTNLKNHLKAKHPEAYEEVLQKDNQNSSVLVVENDSDSMRGDDGAERDKDESGSEENMESTEDVDADVGKDTKYSVIDIPDGAHEIIPTHKEFTPENDKELGSKGDEVREIPVTIGIKLSADSNPVRVRHSAVHEHFHPIECSRPTSKKTMVGSVCNYCQARFTNKVATNLKNHLKYKHPGAYEEVIKRDNHNSVSMVKENSSDFIEDVETTETYSETEENVDERNGITNSELDNDDKAKEVESAENVDVDYNNFDKDPDESTLMRPRSSVVHEHFDKTDLSHPYTNKTVKGAICKHCKTTFSTTISTNLKYHLRSKHREIYSEVQCIDRKNSAVNYINDVLDYEAENNKKVEGRPKLFFALDEFERLDNSNKTERNNYMVRCKHCQKEMLSNQTKIHLKTKHRDVFRIVQAIHREKVVSKVRGGIQKYSQNAHFKCQKCNYSTNFQRRFDTHLFDEHLETSCHTCGIAFNKFDEYYTHLLSHVEPIHCDVCNKYSLDKERFDYHIKMGHRDDHGNGFCPTCGIYCRAVKMHILQVHGSNGLKKTKYPCPQCDFIAKSECHLKDHVNRRHTECNPINCAWCGALTKDFKKHLRYKQCNVPEEERIFKPKVKCKYCGREFKALGKLNYHIRIVHELKMNFCDQCDYKTPVIYNLGLHIKRKHEGKPLKEECQVCHKMCVSLPGHMKIYHGHLVNKTK